MKILDYSSWVHRFRSLPQGEIDLFKPPIVEKQGWCPYCRLPADLALYELRTNEYCGEEELLTERLWYSEDTSSYSLEVWLCSTCGWWDLILTHVEGIGPEGNVNDVSYRAVLKAYDPCDIEIPIQILRHELLRKDDSIYHIHDKKMEELVGSVMKDFYPGCEVTLCGKSGDGGIDLISVISDTPVAIQVKRRKKPNTVERVEAVRAFLGASLVRGYDHLLYVTTADHFTGGPYGAQTEAQRAIQRKLVQQFQLINKHQFFDMMNLVTNKDPKNWARPLRGVFSDLRTKPVDYLF